MALIKDQQLSQTYAKTPSLEFSQWLEDAPTGVDAVVATGDDDLTALLANVNQFSLIAIAFDTFADGRGYSMARMLRREGYQGEIRAVGDVAMDRIEYMHRVGFNAFELREDQNPLEALKKITEINVFYQPSADGNGPAYMS